MPLQLRKGTEAERSSGNFIPAIAEPIYTVDSKKLYLGDGITPGGNPAMGNTKLEEISDVTINSENFALIIQVSVSSNIVTVECSSSHGFDAGDIVTVSLTTNTQLNGSYPITPGLVNNVFTYELTTPDLSPVVDNGVATEVITDGSVLTWNTAENAWVNLPPVTSVSALEDVSLNSLADGEILVYNSTSEVWENGPVATTLGALSDVAAASPTDGDLLIYDAVTSSWISQTLSVSGLGSRTTSSATTGTIADGASADLDITGFKAYMLMSVEVDAACWVTIYSSSGARTADSSRLSFEDPIPGSGVIAEVITTAPAVQLITPSLLGFNDDATPNDTIYLKVENQSGTSTAISVTLKLLRLEA